MDFIEASKEWRKNKIYQNSGQFAYRCSFIKSTGECCKCIRYNDIKMNPYLSTFSEYECARKYINGDIYCKRHLRRPRND